jgi:hypothetical protein
MSSFDMTRSSPVPLGTASHGHPAPAFGDEADNQGGAVLAGGRHPDPAAGWESAWIDLGGEG